MSIEFHATFNSDSTPKLIIDEDGEWRIDLGSRRGAKNVIDNLPDDGEQQQYFLISAYRRQKTEPGPT